jgi:hypothetical protein
MIYRTGGDSLRGVTAAAGTKIRAVAQPHPTGVTVLTKWVYTTQGTAHAVTVMREIGRTFAAAAAGAGATSLTLAGDPGPAGNGLANGDLVGILETDGLVHLYLVNTFSGTALTVQGSGLVAGANYGAALWDFGVEVDTYPPSGYPHNAETVPLSTTRTRENQAGMEAGRTANSPVVFVSANGAAAGTLEQFDWMHVPLAG